MPKSRARKESTSDSDSGPNDCTPEKKAKTSTAGSKSSSSSSKPDDEDSWEISANRFAKLSEFKGKWYINIREYYQAGDDLKPTKKGIMLTLPQWEKFKSFVPEIDEAVKRRV